MSFNLVDTSSDINFIVAYDPTDTVSITREQKDAVWEDFNPFGTIGLATAIFFFLTVLCWSRFFTWASHHDQSFYSTLFTYPK